MTVHFISEIVIDRGTDEEWSHSFSLKIMKNLVLVVSTTCLILMNTSHAAVMMGTHAQGERR